MPSIDSQLNHHRQQLSSLDMRQAFASDKDRATKFSLSACGILLDYAKNLITDETMQLLYQLAEQRHVLEQLQRQMNGEEVNQSEHRPALHTALRAKQARNPTVNNIIQDEQATRRRIYQLRDQLISGSLTGFSNKPINRVVNIGIGGSHLGPLTVCNALPPTTDAPQCDFLASLSPDALAHISHEHTLEETIFIISSKSFSTEETLTNAKNLLALYEKQTSGTEALNHFYAITATPAKAKQLGIADHHIFPIAESIGGRFSLWSAIGLPIIMHIGQAAFEELLQGAYDMDEHSVNNQPTQNMPLHLALLAYWYARYWQTQTHCINVYEHGLGRLPEYLQQLFMESNGKQGGSSEILWGGEGTAIQHSYMQLCHQGEHLIPMDIIFGARPPQANKRSEHEKESHRRLVAHALAQAQALLNGRDEDSAQTQIDNQQSSSAKVSDLIMPGNRPSNMLLYEELTPYSLGALLSLYEHRTALLAYLTETNPFDQWGVELGKQLSHKIYGYLTDKQLEELLDSSTAQLIKRIHQLN